MSAHRPEPSKEQYATVHTPEGMPLPPNALAELQRDMARLGFVVSQIREIEEARQKRLEQQPESGPYAMVRQLARVVGVGIETADMLVTAKPSKTIRAKAKPKAKHRRQRARATA
jgi:transposase